MVPNDYKVMVQKVAETTGFDHTGNAVTQVRIDYTVGNHGPFSEVFPKEGFTAANAKLKLQHMADQLRQLSQ